jgi:nucleoside-triphosphatase THEP1
MKKHFFLEGPIQEGKSTLIRKLISLRLNETGGFSSQRLYGASGKTVGFRITPAAEAMNLTASYSPELSNIFLFFDGQKTNMNPEIFTETAIRYLRESEGKKLVLLDEIGGIELLEPEFRKALYNILEEAPCIGVLKLEISTRLMCDNANINRDCINYHMQLRDLLRNEYHAELLRFERNRADEVEKSIQSFLDEVFLPV